MIATPTGITVPRSDPDYMRQYKVLNKDRISFLTSLNRKSRYARRRAEWLERLGGECTCCGAGELLSFDHVDATTKLEDPSRVLRYWAEERVASEMEKTQIHCMVCNGSKGTNESCSLLPATH